MEVEEIYDIHLSSRVEICMRVHPANPVTDVKETKYLKGIFIYSGNLQVYSYVVNAEKVNLFSLLKAYL